MIEIILYWLNTGSPGLLCLNLLSVDSTEKASATKIPIHWSELSILKTENCAARSMYKNHNPESR